MTSISALILKSLSKSPVQTKHKQSTGTDARRRWKLSCENHRLCALAASQKPFLWHSYLSCDDQLSTTRGVIRKGKKWTAVACHNESEAITLSDNAIKLLKLCFASMAIFWILCSMLNFHLLPLWWLRFEDVFGSVPKAFKLEIYGRFFFWIKISILRLLSTSAFNDENICFYFSRKSFHGNRHFLLDLNWIKHQTEKRLWWYLWKLLWALWKPSVNSFDCFGFLTERKLKSFDLLEDLLLVIK